MFRSFYGKLLVGLALWTALVWSAPFTRLDRQTGDNQRVDDAGKHLEFSSAVSLSEMVARPLFIRGRRPLPIAPVPKLAEHPWMPVPQPPQVLSTSGLILTGTLLSAGRQVALVESPYSPRPQLVAGGDKIGPWTVSNVLPDRIRLQSGSSLAEVRLPPASRQSPNSAMPRPWMPSAFQQPPQR